jgi:hypothetical protein
MLRTCLGLRPRGKRQCSGNSTDRASEEFPAGSHSEKCVGYRKMRAILKLVLFLEAPGIRIRNHSFWLSENSP